MKRLVAVLIAASVLLTGCIQLPTFSFGLDEQEKVKAGKVKPEKEKDLDDEGTLDPDVKPKQKAPGKKGK